ncbi:hypothetical protein MJO29_002979 [Puccinia striiformis f. sp. tritici]|uniref:Uncharacterized protein n=1 Tax=Puccinia striiformis f. sp. tritici PST-78 TaxID=1165861 RepID=A0A0L0VJY2_9BASI|nr:hypothetical protein MJO29_002979 [Puccinia striiformis f. sp. tritici]KNE99314.1 hypothetical protein PSTG_07432 [Puccinia striiformis f. sp. tritici PST-78]
MFVAVFGCSSIEPPESKRVACENGSYINDAIAVNDCDQSLSVSDNFQSNNSNHPSLIDRIQPPVFALCNNDIEEYLLQD